MGVDFYSCDCCGEVFDDCGYWESCRNCNNVYCDECVSKIKYIKDETGDVISCPICIDEELKNKKDKIDKLSQELYEELKSNFTGAKE